MSYINDIGPGDHHEKPYRPPGIGKITEDDLKTLNVARFYKQDQRRLANSAPDRQKTAKLTFAYPNHLCKRYPDKVDYLKSDTKDKSSAPKVRNIPEVGYKGQVVDYKDKLYVADGSIDGVHGRFRHSQRTIGDYAKGKRK